MPGYFNKVILAGNITRDPEVRHTQSGSPVANFSLAINRRIKDKDETTFVDIVAWEKLAETCGTYLKKGSSVLVEGRLTIRNYDDKDGVKRKATEIIISNMVMLDRKDAGGNASNGNVNYSAPASNSTFDDVDLENEIPF